MKKQKKSIDIDNPDDKNTKYKNLHIEENYYGENKFDNYSKYQLTEGKTYIKNKIKSPYKSEKRNFIFKSDYKLSDKQRIFESGNNISNNRYNERNQIINTINERNLRNINTKYYTDYNNENDDLYFEIQSKIYKKVIEQINNNLLKYCKKILSDQYSKFINNLKLVALQNGPKPKPKTYMKKNIIYKNVYKAKKSPDKFILDKKAMENIISPATNYKTMIKDNDKINNKKLSLNNSSKKNIIYSNYYNLNFFENNTNNKYTYSSKRTKNNKLNEFNYGNKNLISQKNVNMNSNNDLNNNNENVNNETNNYSPKKNITKTILRKSPNTNLAQPKKYPNQNLGRKDSLKIDNKLFLNYSTQKKIIDKLQNIKLFIKSNDNDNYRKLSCEEENLEKKKVHFENLMKKLKNIACFKHIEKFIEYINNKNKKEFLEILRQKNKANGENLEKSNENNINDENNIINDKEENEYLENKIENKLENIITNDKENIENNLNDIKNIEISYEYIENKVDEVEEPNKINDINEKDDESLNGKNDDKKINIDENSLEINPELNLNERNDKVDLINNENEKIEIKNNEENLEEINTDIQIKEKENEKYEDKSEHNIDNLNNSINNKEKHEKEKDINEITSENKNENEENGIDIAKDNNDFDLKDSIKTDINKRNLALEKIFNSKLSKEKNNIIREQFIKWKQKTNEENKMELRDEDEKEVKNLFDEKIEENILGNKEEKRGIINIKTLFLDEIDEEEKKEILEEMVFRFRTLLMSSCFNNKECFSYSSY